jgi:hypothetical protein
MAETKLFLSKIYARKNIFAPAGNREHCGTSLVTILKAISSRERNRSERRSNDGKLKKQMKPNHVTIFWYDDSFIREEVVTTESLPVISGQRTFWRDGSFSERDREIMAREAVRRKLELR